VRGGAHKRRGMKRRLWKGGNFRLGKVDRNRNKPSQQENGRSIGIKTKGSQKKTSGKKNVDKRKCQKMEGEGLGYLHKRERKPNVGMGGRKWK